MISSPLILWNIHTCVMRKTAIFVSIPTFVLHCTDVDVRVHFGAMDLKSETADKAFIANLAWIIAGFSVCVHFWEVNLKSQITEKFSIANLARNLTHIDVFDIGLWFFPLCLFDLTRYWHSKVSGPHGMFEDSTDGSRLLWAIRALLGFFFCFCFMAAVWRAPWKYHPTAGADVSACKFMLFYMLDAVAGVCKSRPTNVAYEPAGRDKAQSTFLLSHQLWTERSTVFSHDLCLPEQLLICVFVITTMNKKFNGIHTWFVFVTTVNKRCVCHSNCEQNGEWCSVMIRVCNSNSERVLFVYDSCLPQQLCC